MWAKEIHSKRGDVKPTLILSQRLSIIQYRKEEKVINESALRFKIRSYLKMAELSDEDTRQEYLYRASQLIDGLCSQRAIDDVSATTSYLSQDQAEKIMDFANTMNIGDMISAKELATIVCDEPVDSMMRFSQAVRLLLTQDGRFVKQMAYLPNRGKQRYFIKVSNDRGCVLNAPL